MNAGARKRQRLTEQPKSAAPIVTDMNADCQSIVINAPAADVYRCLLRFEKLPQFITSIVKVDDVSNNHFTCTSIINGEEITSDVTIMMRVPDRRIAWQAVSDQFRLGVIFLDPHVGGATKMTVKIRSLMESLQLSGALREYLTNFKDFAERGSA